MKTTALFLDIKKAFDSVWHPGLLFKLKELNVPDYLIQTVKSYLEVRKMKVRIGDVTSNEFSAEQGVPQGSPLSPLLYNIYCYDIYTREPSNTSYTLQYADDTALIVHNSSIKKCMEKLEVLARDTQRWLNNWRLQSNPSKSEFIIFNHTPSNTSPTITLNNLQIRPKPHAKYLGITIDNKLNLNLHTKTIKRRITTRAAHFRSLTYKNKGISTQNASKIYKTICRPVLDYGHTLYLNCRKPAKKNISVAERTSLRTISRIRNPMNPLHNPSNVLLYQKTKTTPIEERLLNLSTKFSKQPHNLQLIEPLLLARRDGQLKYKYPERTLGEILLSLAEA